MSDPVTVAMTTKILPLTYSDTTRAESGLRRFTEERPRRRLFRATLPAVDSRSRPANHRAGSWGECSLPPERCQPDDAVHRTNCLSAGPARRRCQRVREARFSGDAGLTSPAPCFRRSPASGDHLQPARATTVRSREALSSPGTWTSTRTEYTDCGRLTILCSTTLASTLAVTLWPAVIDYAA